MEALSEFIQEHVAQIEPIEYRANLAWWNQAVTGDEKYAEEMKAAQIELRRLYSSREDYQFLLELEASSDPRINRQTKLLLDRFKENQIPPEMIERMVKLEVEIEASYTNFRPVLKGKEISNNDLKKILMESVDLQERREAWEASKQIGEDVEAKVLELVKLRNEAAKIAGFPDFYTMRLELQELDQKRLFALLDELDRLTSPIWKKYKGDLDRSLAERFHIKAEALRPWHYQDPFFQEAPQGKLDFDQFYKGKDIVEISRKYYASIGLPVDDILARSDLFEREKKNQHAFCMSLDHKQDVRILCNLRDNEYWMGTQLHELGHAVYDKYIDQSLPYLLRTYAHISTTEAIAMLFGRLSTDAKFLTEHCGVKNTTGIDSKKETAATLLVFARWVLVMTHFEKALYQQPGIDLKKYWWDCVEKFQMVKRPENRHKPDWASKLHLACAPVYYQNYILGEMTASHLIRYLGSAPGTFLKTKLFSLGAQYPWEETIKRATGELLNPAYFAEDVSKITAAP